MIQLNSNYVSSRQEYLHRHWLQLLESKVAGWRGSASSLPSRPHRRGVRFIFNLSLPHLSLQTIGDAGLTTPSPNRDPPLRRTQAWKSRLSPQSDDSWPVPPPDRGRKAPTFPAGTPHPQQRQRHLSPPPPPLRRPALTSEQVRREVSGQRADH